LFDGETKQTTLEIQNEAIKYFEMFYKTKEDMDYMDHIWDLDIYPVMFDDASNKALFRLVQLDEILHFIKSFAKEKFLGQDG